MVIKKKLEKKIPCPWCERGAVIVSDARKEAHRSSAQVRAMLYRRLGTGKRARASPIEKLSCKRAAKGFTD